MAIIYASARFFTGSRKVVITGLAKNLGTVTVNQAGPNRVTLPDGSFRQVLHMRGRKFPIPGTSYWGFLLGARYANSLGLDADLQEDATSPPLRGNALITITLTNQPVGSNPQPITIDLDDPSPETILAESPTIPIGNIIDDQIAQLG